MKSQEIARLRLRNQHLTGAPLKTPEQVVGWLGAVQSQEFAVAKWSLAQRTRGATDAELDRAFAAGAILRAHVLRPTWHFVLPADIRWMLELTAPRVHAMNAYYYRKLELDDAVFAKSNALMEKTLVGGGQLTRKELAAVLHRAGIVADGLRLGYLLMRAELDRVVCSGALKGRQHTYALFDERVPQANSLARDEALAELTRRYFTSHGPATLKDFVWWSSLTMAEARRGLAMIGAQLDHRIIGDRTYWSAGALRGKKETSPRVHLLQGYDEYIIAYSESKSVLKGAGIAGVIPQGAILFTHAVVLDGQVVGHWRRIPERKTAAIEAYLSTSLDAAQKRALEAEMDRYGRFMEMPARIAVRSASGA